MEDYNMNLCTDKITLQGKTFFPPTLSRSIGNQIKCLENMLDFSSLVYFGPTGQQSLKQAQKSDDECESSDSSVDPSSQVPT